MMDIFPLYIAMVGHFDHHQYEQNQFDFVDRIRFLMLITGYVLKSNIRHIEWNEKVQPQSIKIENELIIIM